MHQRDTNSNLEAELKAYAAANPGSKAAQWSAHLSRWPVYAAATGAALAMATSADANTIVTGFSGRDITINTFLSPTGARTGVQFGTLGALSFKLAFSRHSSRPPIISSGGLLKVFPTEAGSFVLDTAGGQVARFNAGSSLNISLPHANSGILHNQQFSYLIGFGTLTNVGFGNWPSNNTGFLGFELPNDDLGWLQLKWTGSYPGYPVGLDLMEWGVNTAPGQSLDAGQTYNPEPGTLPLSLLALGATGILAWRKTRRNRLSAAEPKS